MAKEMMKSEEPKNPFKGILGEEPDADEMGGPSDEDEDDYSVTPEEVAAGGEARRAKTDEEFTKAICMLIKLHGGA